MHCESIRIINRASLPGFPTQLDLNENEPFTQRSWKELFEQAVSCPVPAYVIAIAELPRFSSTDRPRYKIYDGAILRNYKDKCAKDSQPFQDLQTRETIQNVYYYAIHCFVLIEDTIQPAKLSNQTFQPYLPTITGEKKRIQQVIERLQPPKYHGLSVDRAEDLYLNAMQSGIDKVAYCGKANGAKIRPVIVRIQTFALDGVNLHCSDHQALGQTQFIVGSAWSQLMHRHRQRIWIWCAEKHGVKATGRPLPSVVNDECAATP